ncbi:unnamed protein product [Amoebophrya sp. A25]|nr:unnamed protein product [Amoebophrya sp. A25]|eukprot:GSA25T00009303001.1
MTVVPASSAAPTLAAVAAASGAKCHIQLGYWKIRGLGSNLKYQLAYSNVPYKMIEYEQGDESTGFSKQCWFDVKWNMGMSFPNLPYLQVVSEGGDGASEKTSTFKISETQAIHQYLAAKFAPHLLGQTPEEAAELNELFGVLEAVKNTCTGVCYRAGAARETIMENCEPGFKRMEDFLKSESAGSGGSSARDFLTGLEPKWIDFYFLELLERFNWLLDDQLAQKYPVLGAYRARVASLNGVAKQLEAELALTFNNKHAPLNGKAFLLKTRTC